MVSSGKLYETNFGDAEGDETDDKKKDAMSWVKSIQGRTQNEKRGSAVSTTSQHKRITNNDIEEKLDLTPNSK